MDCFANTDFGKAALIKMGDAPDNFRLYEAENMGSGTMRVVGGEFRQAKRGPNKGKFSILIPGTSKEVFVNYHEGTYI